jgi:hypothetical protein
MQSDVWPWLVLVAGGPLVLGLALLWGRMRSEKTNRQIDPGKAGDDPSKGM